MRMRNGFEKRAGGCRRDFQREMAEAQKAHARTFKFAIGAVVTIAMLSLGLLSFGIWVIIKLLEHFSVL